jgi:Zn-finger nucleic acid-binding protein
MTLAKELLEKGQSEVVLQYFELCRNFWRMDRGRLDKWSAAVRRAEMPEFSANLTY